MKNLNTKTLLAASISALISINSSAAVVVDGTPKAKELTVTFDHPQSVSIGDGTSTNSKVATGAAVNTTWDVTSNNAVTLKFTGQSYNIAGEAISIPHLAKREVKADNSFDTTYDQLTTKYGIEILESGSTQYGVTSWAGGTSPSGTPDNLVSGVNEASGPTKTLGAIMGTDDGTFKFKLHTTGTGDASATQSGDYTAIITTTVTAEEKSGS